MAWGSWLLRGEKGQDLAEHALIIALVPVLVGVAPAASGGRYHRDTNYVRLVGSAT